MPSLPPKTSSHELLEAEVKELKTTLVRLEKEYKKDKENLNSEVLQLELLVEAKIFREGELESQLEDVRRALAEAKRMSSYSNTNTTTTNKLSNDDHLPQARNHDSPRRGKPTVKPDRGSVSSIASSIHNKEEHSNGDVPPGRRSASQYSEEDLDDGLCEICKEDHAVEVSLTNVANPTSGVLDASWIADGLSNNSAELYYLRRVDTFGQRDRQE